MPGASGPSAPIPDTLPVELVNGSDSLAAEEQAKKFESFREKLDKHDSQIGTLTIVQNAILLVCALAVLGFLFGYLQQVSSQGARVEDQLKTANDKLLESRFNRLQFQSDSLAFVISQALSRPRTKPVAASSKRGQGRRLRHVRSRNTPFNMDFDED